MIPVNPFSRPGKCRPETVGIVWHWTSVPGQEPAEVERFFTSLAAQNENDRKVDRYGSAHAVIGTDGEWRELVPWEEVAYHAGGYSYSSYWADRYPQYTHNQYNSTPNHATIGIELCHPTESGEFTLQTVTTAVELAIMLMGEYTLGWLDHYRHYDITGKECPRWWCNRPDKWERFRKQLKAAQELEA